MAGARERALELGQPELAPPRPLEQCDTKGVESALTSPRTAWAGSEKYPDLPSKAAALLYALSKSQACPDGNKRIALLLTTAFIRINGSTLGVAPGELAEVILRVAASEASDRDAVVADVTVWIGHRLHGKD